MVFDLAHIPKLTAADMAAIANLSYYGVSWDESQATGGYARTGNLAGFAVGATLNDNLLPVQALMRRCVLSDAGVVQYYLDPTDSTKKADGSASNLDGTDGQVMVELPKFYHRYSYSGSTHTHDISLYPLPGFTVHNMFVKNGATVHYRYIGAYEGSLYDVSASIYANGVYQPAHNVGFVAGTKTIIHRTGTVKTVNMVGAAAGTGYQVNDVLTLTGGTTGATVTVATIGGSGEVLTITLTTKGYGYTAGVKATSGGTGADCTVNISALETAMTHPYSKLAVGDRVTITGSADNNSTFTVVTIGDQSFIVSEAVTDEDYASSVIVQTQKDWAASTGDKLSSVSSKAPITQGTRAEFRAIAKNRDTGWRQQDFDLVSGIQLLYLIEYASWNSQSMIGAGLTNFGSTNWTNRNNYNPIEGTGLSNSLGNASGGVDNGANTLGSYMSYRGIENFFGHSWGWVDGFNINDNVPYVCNTDTDFADNTVTNYTALGVTLHNGNGYVVTLEPIGRGFLAASVGGSSSTYITDYYYQSSGWRVAELGARANDALRAGVAYWDLSASSGGRYRNIAGRLAF